jgi:hypothetical protein
MVNDAMCREALSERNDFRAAAHFRFLTHCREAFRVVGNAIKAKN